MDAKSKERIKDAQRACDKSLGYWREAVQALGTNVSVDGAGVIHDRHEYRSRLYEARARIEASLAALDAVDSWPTGSDYDAL